MFSVLILLILLILSIFLFLRQLVVMYISSSDSGITSEVKRATSAA